MWCCKNDILYKSVDISLMMDSELIAIDIERTFGVRFTPDLTGIGLDSVTFPSGMISAFSDIRDELISQGEVVIVDRFPGIGCNSMWFLGMFPESTLYIFQSGNGESGEKKNSLMRLNVSGFGQLKAPGSKVVFLESSVTSVLIPKIDILFLEVHSEINGGIAYDEEGLAEYLNSVIASIDSDIRNLVLRGLFVYDEEHALRINGFGPPLVKLGTGADGAHFVLHLFKAVG